MTISGRFVEADDKEKERDEAMPRKRILVADYADHVR